MDKFVVKPHLQADYTTESVKGVKAHDHNQPPGAKRQWLSESNDLESIVNHWKNRKLWACCVAFCYFQYFFLLHVLSCEITHFLCTILSKL